MTERAPSLFRALPVISLAAASAAAVEVAVASHRGTDVGFSIVRQLVALCGVFSFAVAITTGVTGALLGLAALVRSFRREGLYDPAQRFRIAEIGPAALVTVPLTVAVGGATVHFFARQFRNRELSSLLAAGSVVAISAIALFATGALVVVVRRLRLRLTSSYPGCALLAWLPGALLLAGFVLLDRATRLTGSSQLDFWLAAPPLAALATFAAVRYRPPRVLAARRAPAVALAVALGAGSIGAFSPPVVTAELSISGPWSRLLVTPLRAATDFDGDGYSAWLAGGDCDGANPDVNPRAPEIPGNGVDENCLGGDGHVSAVARPKPSGIRLFHADKPMNLVLVTIETLRADHVSFLGYARPTTPRLAELARRSVVFERLYANSPTTRLSLPSLLSGTLASHIDWQPQAPEKAMRRVGPATPWLPELLRAAGYETIAVHASFRAFTGLESAGFDRGFDRYDVTTELVYRGGTMQGFPGGEQVDRALSFVEGRSGRPFFLWVHLLEPHYAYEQPPLAPRFGTGERDLYDAEIAEADRQAGRLLDGLAERGLLERSIVLVTGDHGEEFGEHGERWHTSNLYEPQLHTAGLIFVPGLEPRRLRTPVVLTDFAPTLLDLLGKPEGLQRMQGRNLLPLLRSGDQALPPIFLENFRVDSGRAYQAGVLAWPYKLVYREDGGRLELYDIQRDPAERDDLYARAPDVADELVGWLRRLRESRPAR